MNCPICNNPLVNGVCPKCSGKPIPYDMLDKVPELPDEIRQDSESQGKSISGKAPWALWLLPILFGLIGSGFAAVVADLKYHASWVGYIVLGVFISIADYFLIQAWINYLIESI